jgi:hypothetical protein
MKMTPKTLAIASVLAAAAVGTGASAQTYGQAYQTYQQQQAQYQAQQTAYNAARAKYEADRAAYDARYGYGAYERLYGPFRYAPTSTYGYGYGSTYPYSSSYPYSSYPYSGTYPASSYPYSSSYPYASTYPYGSTYPYSSTPSPYGYNPYYAGAYGTPSSYGTAVPCSTGSSSVNLGALASIAQAAMGSRSLSVNSIVNQAILGAVVDRALGSRAISSSQCDSRGYYYTYDQTQPYREGYYDAYGRWVSTMPSSTYASCRIAPAPTNAYGSEYRYVRVCPDGTGRYRITG